VLSPSHFRDATPEVRWVLLAALLVERQWEITDTLVELLISTVHAINARADRRVTEEMVASFKRVRNKTVLLAKISQASLDRPDGAVRDVVFPVAGGAQTLRLAHTLSTSTPWRARDSGSATTRYRSPR